MSQLASVVEPYGEVNIFPDGEDAIRVKARGEAESQTLHVLMEKQIRPPI